MAALLQLCKLALEGPSVEGFTPSRSFLLGQGVLYCAIALLFMLSPQSLAPLLRMDSMTSGEAGAYRTAGLAVLVVAYFYIQMARVSSDRGVPPATLHRFFVPLAMGGIVMLGAPWHPCAALAILDLVGACLTTWSWLNERRHGCRMLELCSYAVQPQAQGERTSTHTFLLVQGVLYSGLGLGFMLGPQFLAPLLLMGPMTSGEAGVYRILGIEVVIIGYLYIQNARSNLEHAVAATTLDRLLVPLPLAGIWMLGAPWQLCAAFGVLDPLLACLTAWSWQRSKSEDYVMPID
eukprot:TRINITY_DN16673_c0_g1_i1.p1 TRINITY_DN16673_c0_g1~~TRINITY_DN16673_c0_g1_i1.p1  ORF type:complete len:292 (+),score=18.41 TRINITY_DN16673_c0_g1_i1:98-973(+)